MRAGVLVPLPGETLVLAESDYLYGVGPVLAQVIDVLAPIRYRGEPWWHVEARAADGTPDNHGGWVVRELYVRAAALPSARPAAGGVGRVEQGGWPAVPGHGPQW